MNYEKTNLKKFSDKRGYLIEFLKFSELHNAKKKFGQIYCATLLPQEKRGNHYHAKKDEWEVVIGGKAKITLEDIKTKKRKEFIVGEGSDDLLRVRIGKNIAHVIKNIDDKPLVIVAYTTEMYSKSKVDQKEYIIS